MAKVVIPFKNVIWFDEDPDTDTLAWLNYYVGKPQLDWCAATSATNANQAIFFFNRDEDALAFKLRWR